MTPMEQLSSDADIALAREKYSKWHRPPTLSTNCYMVDMDWVEMRVVNGQLTPVAFIECITYRGENIVNADKEKPLTKAKEALCNYLAKTIPTYVVWVNPENLGKNAVFLVKRVGREYARVLTEADYKQFIELL